MDVAIRLLFSHEDSLAVHTLAFASYGILKNIAERADHSDTLAALNKDAVCREGAVFWNKLHELGNELKHSKYEPTAMLRGMPEEFNEALLFVDCSFLRELYGLPSPEGQALWLWYHALFFVNIDDAPPEYWEWLDKYQNRLHAETRAERIEIGSHLLATLRSAPSDTYRMEPDQVLLPWRLVIRLSRQPRQDG